MSVNAVYFCVYLAGILFETLAEIINRRKRHMFVLRSLNALLFAALFSSSALAQVAIGYLDLNAILSQYPDMNQANAELASYEEKLGGDIRVFQDYLNSQIQAYVEKQKTGLSD